MLTRLDEVPRHHEKNGNSDAMKITFPLMNKIYNTPSASSCTLYWSLLALWAAFCACYGFDPGGARLPDKRS